jgi:outer membrane protein OmpA-like peptidoglycan-associated protein
VEEWKLQSTLEELHEVLRKYGSVVPVKLYIAGCTDTVGDKGHNKDLSRERARAISTWLRSKGYAEPIYYYGFGETLLAIKTGDGVNEGANRRVLYIVTSDVPPGLPSVGWKVLD